MSYERLVDVLSQLEEDQSFYEAQFGHEFRGMPHFELIDLGGRMCKKVRLFADFGLTNDLQGVFVAKVIDVINEYVNLLVPPKVCGGYCPCLKPSRIGPEYEKRFVVVLSKVVSVLFESEAVVIEFCGERLNLASMHFIEYLSRMNVIHGSLTAASEKVTEALREEARIELIAIVGAVRRFLISFNSDTIELISESEDNLDTLSEILVAPAEWNVAQLVLVKVISTLQKILNSAVKIAFNKATENLRTLNSLDQQLLRAWNTGVALFCAIEGRVSDRNLIDILHTLVRESEDIHNTTNSRIKGAIKNWTSVKCRSVQRPIMICRNEFDSAQELENAFFSSFPLPLPVGYNSSANATLFPNTDTSSNINLLEDG